MLLAEHFLLLRSAQKWTKCCCPPVCLERKTASKGTVLIPVQFPLTHITHLQLLISIHWELSFQSLRFPTSRIVTTKFKQTISVEIDETFLFRKSHSMRPGVRSEEFRSGCPETDYYSFKIKIEYDIIIIIIIVITNALEWLSGSECLEIKLGCLVLMAWKLHSPISFPYLAKWNWSLCNKHIFEYFRRSIRKHCR